MVRRRTSARKKRTAYPALGAQPAKRSGAWVILILGALVLVNLYVFVWDKKTGVRAIKQQAEQTTPAMAMPSAPLAPAAGSAGSATPVTPPPTVPAPTPAAAEIAGKVGKSDTLGRLLKKSGLSAAEADEIIRALSGALDFRTIRAGEPFRIQRGADGRVKHFELELGKGHRVVAERQASGELTGTSEDTPPKS